MIIFTVATIMFAHIILYNIYFNIISYEASRLKNLTNPKRSYDIILIVFGCSEMLLGALAFPMKYYNYVRMFVLRGCAAIIVQGF